MVKFASALAIHDELTEPWIDLVQPVHEIAFEIVERLIVYWVEHISSNHPIDRSDELLQPGI